MMCYKLVSFKALGDILIFDLFVGMNQIVVGSFLSGNQHEQKPKKQKNEYVTTTTATAAVPISSADPKLASSTSFRGDNWSSMPPDSRNKPTDINVSLPGG